VVVVDCELVAVGDVEEYWAADEDGGGDDGR
jgi:hypothetical protein